MSVVVGGTMVARRIYDSIQYISLRKRLVILLIVMILPFIAFSIFKAVDINEKLGDRYRAETLSLAQTVARDLDDYITATGDVLIPIAGNKDVRTQNLPAVKAFLDSVVPQYPYYHLIAFVDMQGNVKVASMSSAMADSEDARKLSKSLSVRDTACYWRGAKANGIAVGDFMYSKITKMPVVHVTYPVYDPSGKRIGFIAAAFDLTKIQKKLMRTNANRSTILSIVDDKGVYIARSSEPQKWVGRSIATTERYKKMRRHHEGNFVATSAEKTQRVYGYDRAQLVPWVAVAGIDEAYIQAQAANELAHHYTIFIPLLLIAIFGWLWIGRDVDHLHKKTEELSLTDALTGLGNCRKLHQDMVQEFSRAKRYHDVISFAMIDIDNFKMYNDNNGHQLGDEALASVAAIMRHAMRDIDLVYRYGGEELSVLMPGTDKAGAIAVADRIRRDIELASFIGEEYQPAGRLTVSIGVATYPYDSIAKEGLINCADVALYEAKHAGRNQLKGFDENSPHMERDKSRQRFGMCL